MGHDKLRKFRENETFSCLLQPSSTEVLANFGEQNTATIDNSNANSGLRLKDHPIKGHWCEKMFAKKQPIIVELGCGKGEYTIDLALRNPGCNYIGVDIKGARLWKGAKYATEHKLPNVAFLRTRIEFIEAFFAPGEVSQIWLTFSDPQMKSENSRLTSPRFLSRYRNFLQEGGIVHLKTDSMFLHQYTVAVALQNNLKILFSTADLYSENHDALREGICNNLGNNPVTFKNTDALFEVQTFYERMFLDMGLKITYLSFLIDHNGPYLYPVFDSQFWREKEGNRRSFGHER